LVARGKEGAKTKPYSFKYWGVFHPDLGEGEGSNWRKGKERRKKDEGGKILSNNTEYINNQLEDWSFKELKWR